MTAKGSEAGGERKLTVEQLQGMLSGAFHAGCKLGFNEALEGAKSEAHSRHCEDCVVAIDQICGPNAFAVMFAFESWLKNHGSRKQR